MSSPKAFLSRKELAEYLSYEITTLYRMERNGEGPAPHFLSSAKRAKAIYRMSDVDEWLKTRQPEHMRNRKGFK